MHFLVLALTPPGTTILDAEATVNAMTADTDFYDRFDWWMVGGRFTGWLTRAQGLEYDPTTDPRNLATCHICNGTGTRDDVAVMVERFGQEWLDRTNGCNSCLGKGICSVGSASFAPYDDDVLPARDLAAAEVTAYGLLLPDGRYLTWDEEDAPGFPAFPGLDYSLVGTPEHAASLNAWRDRREEWSATARDAFYTFLAAQIADHARTCDGTVTVTDVHS